MIVFLDFEASSLDRGSYPIEVGWAMPDGDVESHLIAPAAGWTDWSYSSEAVHRISQDDLILRGRPIAEVANRALAVLGAPGVVVVSDQPRWEQLWLDRLMRAAGRSDHGITITDAVHVYVREGRRLLALALADDHRAQSRLLDELSDLIGDVQHAEEQRRRVRHRAGPDAEGNRWILGEIRRRVDARLSTECAIPHQIAWEPR